MSEQLNLDQFEALAKAAKRGPWTYEEDSGLIISANGLMVAGVADIEYMIAANPATMLALIARVRELEAVTRWIPVTERLPEMEQSIEFVSCGGVFTGDYGESFPSGLYYFFDDEAAPIHHVTHWRLRQSLPGENTND